MIKMHRRMYKYRIVYLGGKRVKEKSKTGEMTQSVLYCAITIHWYNVFSFPILFGGGGGGGIPPSVSIPVILLFILHQLSLALSFAATLERGTILGG